MEPSFNLTEVKAMLGLPLTEEFISDKLGVAPDTIIKRSRFYSATKVNTIIDRLIEHLKESRSGISK